jgi:molecular chaperone DnaJ
VDGRRIKKTLPRGVQSHEVLTIPGEGVPSVRTGRKGNLLVQVLVETPRNLTRRQEELLRELGELDEKHVSSERKGWFDKLRNLFKDGSRAS